MTIKSIDIEYDGVPAVVTYEDDLPFGELENIMTSCVNMADVNDVKINIPQYRTMIFLRTLRSAPFKVNDSNTMKTLKSSIVEKILKGVMADFPLATLLERWTYSVTSEQIGQNQ